MEAPALCSADKVESLFKSEHRATGPASHAVVATKFERAEIQLPPGVEHLEKEPAWNQSVVCVIEQTVTQRLVRLRSSISASLGRRNRECNTSSHGTVARKGDI